MSAVAEKSKPFPHPSFIQEDTDKSPFPARGSPPINPVFLFQGSKPTEPPENASKPKYPHQFRHEDSEASMLNNINLVNSPIKPQESIKSKGQRYSSAGSLEEKASGFTRLLGECLGLKKMKSLKMRIQFGMAATQEYERKFNRNYVTTTKFR